MTLGNEQPVTNDTGAGVGMYVRVYPIRLLMNKLAKKLAAK